MKGAIFLIAVAVLGAGLLARRRAAPVPCPVEPDELPLPLFAEWSRFPAAPFIMH